MTARIRTMNFDAVASSAPLDATASAVRDGSGDLYDGPALGDRQHWKAPPKPTHLRPDTLPDLTGQRVGARLTIVRFHGLSGRSDPRAMWLVRCDCGDYELRRHKKIMKAGCPHDACGICSHVRELQIRTAKPSTARTREASARVLDKIAKQRRRA